MRAWLGLQDTSRRGICSAPARDYQTVVRNFPQCMAKRQAEPPGTPHWDPVRPMGVQTCRWVTHELLPKRAILSYQARCDMLEDVHRSGPICLTHLLDVTHDFLPKRAFACPTVQERSHLIALLGKRTTYSENGFQDTVDTRQVLHFISVCVGEMWDVMSAFHQSSAMYTCWNQLHPTLPRIAYRISCEERFVWSQT